MDVLIFWDKKAPAGVAGPVARLVSRITGNPAKCMENPMVPTGWAAGRGQMDAAAVLDSLARFRRLAHIDRRILLIVGQDLYRQGDLFLFGLARPEEHCAVLSTARLSNDYYGRPPDDGDLIGRMAKESCHEIGHLFGLSHCDHLACIMHNPHSLSELDMKNMAFCEECRERLDTNFQE